MATGSVEGPAPPRLPQRERPDDGGVYLPMTRAASPGRPWRSRVLLGGVVLLAAAAVFLLDRSRPRAGTDAEAASTARSLRPARRALSSRLASGAPVEGGDVEEGEEEEASPGIELRVLDALSGDPLPDKELSVSTGAVSRSASTDGKGLVSVEPTEEELRDGVAFEAEGYASARLSAEELGAMLEAGAGVLRLAPLGKLTARFLDARGTPLSSLEVCRTVDDESRCQTAPSGSVELDGIPPGEHVFWATAEAVDEEGEGRGDHLAHEVLRFEAGEHKRVDFRSSSRLDRRLTVELRDVDGQPLESAQLELTIEPRHPASSPLERAVLAAIRNSERTSNRGSSWSLPLAGWYRVRATPRLGPDRTLAEIEVFVGDDAESSAVLTVPLTPVRCRLVDEGGQPLPIRGYALSFETEGGHDTYGGGRPGGDVRFYWQPGVTRVEVNLIGPEGRRGELALHGPQQPCEVKLDAGG